MIRRIKFLFSAPFLLPLLLASPMIRLGRYGVSIAELMVVLAGVFILLSGKRARIETPLFLIVFTILFSVGWLGALYNTQNWGVAVGLHNVNFIYHISLPFLTYWIGRQSAANLEGIVANRVTLIVIGFVCVIASLYPFVSFDIREAMIQPFVRDITRVQRRLYSARFPGLGVNANLYSFMFYIFMIFGLHALMKRKDTVLAVIGSAHIVTLASSKTVIILMLVSSFAIVSIGSLFIRDKSLKFGKRILLGFCLCLGLIIVAMGAAAAMPDEFVFADRFEKFVRTGNEINSMENRIDHWVMGMNRVRLAPLLGIAEQFGGENTSLGETVAPHNEFIYYWMTYGFFGMLAYIFLIGYFLVLNILRRSACAPSF